MTQQAASGIVNGELPPGAGHRTWITAGGGFIGRHTATACGARGATVSGLGHGDDSGNRARRSPFSLWHSGEITFANLTRMRLGVGKPDVVIHMAGSPTVGAATQYPLRDFTRTVTPTAELLEWIRLESPATVVVLVSSAAVYGRDHTTPIAEAHEPRPVSPYGEHRRMAESLCRSYGLTYGVRSVIARLFSVYGPGLQKQLLWEACRKLERDARRLQLDGNGTELRDWVHIDDAAATLAELAAHADCTAPAFNVGTGHGASVAQVASGIALAWARTAGVVPPQLEFSGQTRAGDPPVLVADVSALGKIGLDCRRAVADELAAYVDWFFQRTGTLR